MYGVGRAQRGDGSGVGTMATLPLALQFVVVSVDDAAARLRFKLRLIYLARCLGFCLESFLG
jgi:hypothetical protein